MAAPVGVLAADLARGHVEDQEVPLRRERDVRPELADRQVPAHVLDGPEAVQGRAADPSLDD